MMYKLLLQNWSKKGASEKGRGGGGKLPPRFAKKQSSQQQQQQQPPPPPPQQQQHSSQSPAVPPPQAQHLTPSQPAASPQSLEGTAVPQPSIPPPALDFTSKGLLPTQPHSTLGTELWDNKVASSAVLPEVKKREWGSGGGGRPCVFISELMRGNVCCSWSHQPPPAPCERLDQAADLLHRRGTWEASLSFLSARSPR